MLSSASCRAATIGPSGTDIRWSVDCNAKRGGSQGDRN